MIKKVSRKIQREIKNLNNKILDKKYNPKDNKLYKKIQYSYINLSDNSFECDNLILKNECLDYIKHNFDILGTGKVKFRYKYSFNNDLDKEKFLKKLVGDNYYKYSKELLKHIGKEYEFIDWGLDIKSGYRFKNTQWYKDIKIGKEKGVDIKIPWELSRMYHLPIMAIGAVNYKELRNQLIKEFKNEVIDFIATNKVNRGVNWVCSMEVAIRAINILIAYDIFKEIDSDKIIDSYFKEIISRSIYEHGKFIYNNLEWDYGNRANHYLSNIMGLLFISLYLEDDYEIDNWLMFSLKELRNEFEFQFNEDGTNFEGSTNYHVLSGEMIILSTAIILGAISKKNKKEVFEKVYLEINKNQNNRNNINDDNIKNYIFNNEFIEKLCKMKKFVQDISKNNSEIPQIGDNDSGRIVKLTLNGTYLSADEIRSKYESLEYNRKYDEEKMIFDENLLIKNFFLREVDSIFGIYENDLEGTLIRLLSNGNKLNDVKLKFEEISIKKSNYDYKLPFMKEYIVKFGDYGIENLELESLQMFYYKDFGLIILKSDYMFLSMYIGGTVNSTAGHTHNDKLSIELRINEDDVFMDPGTYLYTSFVDKRNEFRSINAHNVPIVEGKEQNIFTSLFSVKQETKCDVLILNKKHIKVLLRYRDIEVIREILIYRNEILIKDYSNKDFKQNFGKKLYSNGYGKKINVNKGEK